MIQSSVRATNQFNAAVIRIISLMSALVCSSFRSTILCLALTQRPICYLRIRTWGLSYKTAAANNMLAHWKDMLIVKIL